MARPTSAFRPGGARRFGLAILLVLLGGASRADAHGLGISPVFFFSSPQGPGNTPEQGVFELTWIDDETDVETSFELYARAEPIPPLVAFDLLAPAGAVKLTENPIPMPDEANAFQWDTRALPPGCYQPFTLMSDADGTWNAIAHGKVVVSNGDNSGAGIWITNGLVEELPEDGRFEIKFRVHEPEDASRVTLKYGVTRRPQSLTTIVEDLPVPAGGGDFSHTFDFSQLPEGQYAIYAEVVSEDGSTCAAFWPQVVKVPSQPRQPGDGGSPNAGGPVQPSPGPRDAPEVDCACSGGGGGGGLFPVLAVLLVALRRRAVL